MCSIVSVLILFGVLFVVMLLQVMLCFDLFTCGVDCCVWGGVGCFVGVLHVARFARLLRLGVWCDLFARLLCLGVWCCAGC